MMLRLYQLLNILSIDVAAGAVVGCAFFAKIFGVTVLPYGFITLGLTVWIIYTSDHLLDVWRKQLPASTERHRFHQQHATALLILIILSLVIVAIQVIYIRRPVLIGGILLSLIVGIYFILQKRLKYLKELFAAVLYSGGVLIAPLSLLQRPLASFELIFILQFFLTALVNLLLFSWFDVHSDARDNHPSFAVTFGESVTQRMLNIFLLVNIVLTFVQLFFNPDHWGQLLVIFTMNALLGLIFVKRKYFGINDRYRLMGDAVFLLPLIYLMLETV